MRLLPMFARTLSLAALFGTAASPAADARQVPPSAAPAEWVRYAEIATATLTNWLQVDDAAAATRLRAYLGQLPAGTDGKPATLIVKLWIERDGRISRVEFPPFADEAANRDLRDLVAGRMLAPPPRRMLLPLRIALQMSPDLPSA